MRLPRTRSRSTASIAVILAVAWTGLTGCESETVTFARVEEVTETVARFERLVLEGRERVEYGTQVGSQTHPELYLNWTNLNGEIEVDVYVVRLENYETEDGEGNEIPPSELDYFWSSVPEEGPKFGDRRPTLISLHPDVGSWVVVFYNPKDRSPSTRALLSATVEYSYFSQQ